MKTLDDHLSTKDDTMESGVTALLPDKVTGLISAVVIAAIAAGWFGWSWYDTAFGEAQYARERDAALVSGSRGLVTFSTLDHRDPEQGLDRWADSATGPLLDGLNSGRAHNAAAIRQAGTTTIGKVLSQALTELDSRAGHARMIGVVEVVVTPPQGQPVTKHNRLQGDLVRTPDGWKLSALGPVAVSD